MPTDYGFNSLVVNIVQEVSRQANCSLEVAFHSFLSSELFRMLADVENGMYVRSPVNIAYLFVNNITGFEMI